MNTIEKFQYELALQIRKHTGLYEFLRKYYIRHLFFTKKILACAVFITNRCNLKCRHCLIWNKMPKVDLSPSAFAKLTEDRMLKNSVFVITGGEFELHPECDEILKLIRDRKHIIATNAFDLEKLTEKVKKFGLRTIQLSLDGNEEAHDKIRGINGSYKKALKAIKELKELTNIHLSYTVTPWNTPDDLLHVKSICKKNNLNLGINYLYNAAYYGVSFKNQPLYDASEYVEDFNFYTSRYKYWLNGKLSLLCNSIRLMAFVFPEGNVSLCSCKTDKILGNVYENTFSEIWSSERTKKMHMQFARCNDCWSSCNRSLDLQLSRPKIRKDEELKKDFI